MTGPRGPERGKNHGDGEGDEQTSKQGATGCESPLPSTRVWSLTQSSEYPTSHPQGSNVLSSRGDETFGIETPESYPLLLPRLPGDTLQDSLGS